MAFFLFCALSASLARAQITKDADPQAPPTVTPPQSTFPAQISVTYPFGYAYHPGWTPVIVTIRYTGKSVVEADCRVTIRDAGSGPRSEPYQIVHASVSLSPGSTKQVCLYPLLGFDSYWADTAVELLDPAGKPLSTRYEQRLEWGGQSNWVVALGRNPASSPVPAFSGRVPSGSWNQIQTRPVSWDPADVPDRWIGYFRAALVVLNDCPLDSFRPEAEQALLDWVARGGAVMISPGKDPAWLSGRLIKAFWPAAPTIEDRSPADFAPIEKAGLPEPANPGMEEGAAASSLRGFDPSTLPVRIPFARAEGESLMTLADGKTPFLSRRPYGFGWVYFIGVDVSAPPFSNWPGREGMWTRIVSSVLDQPGSHDTFAVRAPYDLKEDRRYGGNTPGDTFLAALSRGLTRLPPVLLVIFGILAYVVIVGPVNFFWLRKKGWHQWLCLTIPAIALVFVAANLLLGYATRGLKTVGQRLVVTEIPDNAGPALETQLYALCSAAPARYRFSADPASIPWRVPAGEGASLGVIARATWRQGGHFALEEVPLQTWDMAYVRSDAVRPGFGRIRLIPEGTGFVVKNESTHPLGKGAIFIGGLTVPVGAIAPGGTETLMPTASWDGDEARAAVFDGMGLRPQTMQREVLEYLVGDGQVGGSQRPIYVASLGDGVGTLSPSEDWVKTVGEWRIVIVHGPIPRAAAAGDPNLREDGRRK